MAPIPLAIDGTSSDNSASRSRSPVMYFLLVFALSIPFWVIGAVSGIQLLPGVSVAALMFICPTAAAVIFVYLENKTAGVTNLLKRSFDYKRIRARIWYVPILLLMPAVSTLSYVAMRLMGVPLPIPQFAMLTTLGLLLIFFAEALGEELGWSGYAIDPMQERWGALRASALLGLVWASWHIVPLMETHRPPAWIAWWCLGTVTTRVLMVWLYNNTGKSVFAMALFHSISNLSWQLFPVRGSYFDPRINGLLMTIVAAMVTLVWGVEAPAHRKST